MGDKVDMSEVNELAKTVKKETSKLKEYFSTVESSRNDIVNIDSFRGESARAVNSYLDELHGPVIEAFQVVFDDIDESFDEHISTFQSMVDSDESAIVQSDYLRMEVGVKIEVEYNNMKNHVKGVNKLIDDVSDLVTISRPDGYSITKSYNDLSDTLEDLEDNFQQYQGKGKKETKKMDEMMELIDKIIRNNVKVDAKEKSVEFKKGKDSGEMRGFFKYLNTMDSLLEISASNAVDEHVNYKRKGQSNKANSDPHISKKSGKEKAKYVAKKTVKGPGSSAKRSIGKTKGFGKALGPLSAGIDGYTNYQDAKADGLEGKDAVVRTVSDTVVDTAVGGAVQAGTTALFTAAIPIPGVGTAVGAVAGIGLNALLNKEWGDTKTSAMDVVKKPFRKIASWFS